MVSRNSAIHVEAGKGNKMKNEDLERILKSLSGNAEFLRLSDKKSFSEESQVYIFLAAHAIDEAVDSLYHAIKVQANKENE